MNQRVEVTFSDEQYARLRAESARTGLGLAELVRRAVERVYDEPLTEAEQDALVEDRRAAFAQAAGIWKDRDFDGVTYVELIRRGLDPDTDADERRRALDDSFGAWKDRDFDGEQYVERMRRGMAHRLSRDDTY